MNFRLKARDLPGRVAAGAYILHAELEKWRADDLTCDTLERTWTLADSVRSVAWFIGVDQPGEVIAERTRST